MVTLAELIHDVETRTAGASRLDMLSAAALDADHLGELADHLVGHFVDAARADGASWAMVGRSLGTTRQAAQQRFVAGNTSLESFTNRAAVVVLTAQNLARERGHAELLSQHLVLGLLAEWDGFAGQALEAAGATKEAVKEAMEASLPADGAPSREHVPSSAGIRKALELATRESLRLGHGYVGTEHLLLGLLESGDEPTVGLLAGLGASKDGVEAWTLSALETWRSSRA